MRHVTGDSMQQTTLLPDTLDDYVDEDHPVSVWRITIRAR